MTLTPQQQAFCDARFTEHQHLAYDVDIQISDSLTLNNFHVEPQVLRPEITSGIHFARYLAENQQEHRHKKVLDMGCGSGIQGIVMGLQGAQRVDFSDISIDSIRNTQINAERFGLRKISRIYCGDLFSPVPKQNRYDIIVFNQPFWHGSPDSKHSVMCAWFNDDGLLERFLTQAPNYLAKNGYLFMPFFDFASKENNPQIAANILGLNVTEVYKKEINTFNECKGRFLVYKISLEK